MHRRRGVDPPMKVRRGTVTPSHHVDNIHLESPRGNGETDGDFCDPMSWEAMSLGEFITLKRGYDLPSNMRVHGHVPVVSSSGTTGYHNVAKVEGPGVITGRYGTLGGVFFVADSFWPLNTSLYVQDFKGNDPKFSAYFLKTVLAKRSSDKAAVPGVNRNDLHRLSVRVTRDTGKPASCITFLSEQAFAPQNTRFWSRRRVWFQFTVGEDKPPMLSVDNRGKGVLSMDCSAKRSPL